MATKEEIEAAATAMAHFEGSGWFPDYLMRANIALTAAEMVRASAQQTVKPEDRNDGYGTDPTWPGPNAGQD